MGYSPWDCKELDMTKVTEHTRTHPPFCKCITNGNYYLPVNGYFLSSLLAIFLLSQSPKKSELNTVFTEEETEMQRN